jgi:hypothetical protein
MSRILSEYVTAAELAPERGRSEATLERWRKRRITPAPTHIGIGKSPMYRIETVHAWLDARAPATSSPQIRPHGRPHAGGTLMTARRINDTRPMSERGLDPYSTPPCATQALLRIENIPGHSLVYDSCVMNGAILDVCVQAVFNVIGADICDYGWPTTIVRDFLTAPAVPNAVLITNPPFARAREFIEKALDDGHAFAAFLLRTNFLESNRRKPFFDRHPPNRVWMVHRLGYAGSISSSNQSFMWAIWETGTEQRGQLGWFDHAEAA